MPKIAPAIIAAVSVRKTWLAILALQNKICIKSQGLKSSYDLGKLTVTAVKYVLWKHSKATFCLDLCRVSGRVLTAWWKFQEHCGTVATWTASGKIFLKHFLSSTTSSQQIMIEPTFILVQRSNSLSSQNWLTLQLLNSLNWKSSNFNHPPLKSRLWSLLPWLLLLFTESQSDLGRHLQESSRKNPCSKQGHTKEVVQGHIQSVLSISKNGESKAPLGNLFQWLTTLSLKKV